MPYFDRQVFNKYFTPYIVPQEGTGSAVLLRTFSRSQAQVQASQIYRRNLQSLSTSQLQTTPVLLQFSDGITSADSAATITQAGIYFSRQTRTSSSSQIKIDNRSVLFNRAITSISKGTLSVSTTATYFRVLKSDARGSVTISASSIDSRILTAIGNSAVSSTFRIIWFASLQTQSQSVATLTASLRFFFEAIGNSSTAINAAQLFFNRQPRATGAGQTTITASLIQYRSASFLGKSETRLTPLVLIPTDMVSFADSQTDLVANLVMLRTATSQGRSEVKTNTVLVRPLSLNTSGQSQTQLLATGLYFADVSSNGSSRLTGTTMLVFQAVPKTTGGSSTSVFGKIIWNANVQTSGASNIELGYTYIFERTAQAVSRSIAQSNFYTVANTTLKSQANSNTFADSTVMLPSGQMVSRGRSAMKRESNNVIFLGNINNSSVHIGNKIAIS